MNVLNYKIVNTSSSSYRYYRREINGKWKCLDKYGDIVVNMESLTDIEVLNWLATRQIEYIENPVFESKGHPFCDIACCPGLYDSVDNSFKLAVFPNEIFVIEGPTVRKAGKNFRGNFVRIKCE